LYCKNGFGYGQSGFTLVEVMLVLVIIALIAIFAAPEVGNWQPNIRLKGAAREFYANMQKAKLHAIKTNSDVNVTISTNCPGGSYLFEEINGTTGAVVRVVAQVTAGDFTDSYKGVCINNFDAGVRGFTPRGMSIGSGGSIGGNVTFTSVDIPKIYKVGQTISGAVTLEIP